MAFIGEWTQASVVCCALTWSGVAMVTPLACEHLEQHNREKIAHAVIPRAQSVRYMNAYLFVHVVLTSLSVISLQCLKGRSVVLLVGRLLLVSMVARLKAATHWRFPVAMKMTSIWETASPTLAQVSVCVCLCVFVCLSVCV